MQLPFDQLKARLAKQAIHLPDPADVATYLRNHEDLAQLLPRICSQAREEFGEAAELILTVYRDPEIEDRYLSMEVRLPAYDKTIMTRLDKVTEAFDEELAGASGYFLVNTFFRPTGIKHGPGEDSTP